MNSSEHTPTTTLKRRDTVVEFAVAVLAVAVLFYLLRSMLFFGETTLAHDNVMWNYPVFQYFAENIINNNFPFWNPFTHGGEPFYPLPGQMRLLDPPTVAVIWLGQFFTNDLTALFNWNRVIQTLITALGAYLALRPAAKTLFARVSLIPVLLFSSFFLGSFRQDAIINQFAYAPYVYLFLARIIHSRDLRWHNWILLGVFIGLNWQSYFFTGTWIFLLFFAVGLIMFKRELIVALVKSKGAFLKAGAVVFIIAAMAAPNMALMAEKDGYVFPARMIDSSDAKAHGGPIQYEAGAEFKKISGINMPYSFIKATGTFSNITDFFQMISPDGNKHIHWEGVNVWGHPSEAYIYLGFLVWAIGVLGMVAGDHGLKRVWLTICAGFALLMLGPPALLHTVMYYLYPPMWFVRHSHAFVLFFEFSFLYFYVLGLNRLSESWGGGLFEPDERKAAVFEKYGFPLVFFFLAVAVTAVALKVYALDWLRMMGRLASSHSSVFFAAAAPLMWFLKRECGRKFLFIAVITAQLSLVAMFTSNTEYFVLRAFVFFTAPLAAYLILRGKRAGARLRLGASYAAAAVFLLFLTGDLTSSFLKTRFFYGETKYPSMTSGILKGAQAPAFRDYRVPFVPSSEDPQYQAARYLSLVYRVPDAMSSVKEDDQSEVYRSVKKNVLFESAKSAKILPSRFYEQDGIGGYFKESFARGSGVFFILAPSSKGHSTVRYRDYKIQNMIGSYVWVRVSAKSDTRLLDTVQLSLEDGTDRPPTAMSYKISGDWEDLIVGRLFDKKSRFIGVNLDDIAIPGTDAFAYASFKDLSISTAAPVAEVLKDTDYALRSRRWSSFFLPVKYFNLINSGISPPAFEKVFAVNGPLIQFKKGRLNLDDETAFEYLRAGDAAALKPLDDYVILDNGVSPVQTAAPSGRYNGGFRYDVNAYDYNALNLAVSSAENGFLYWADGYDDRWRAYVNGKETPVYRANVNFKAISLPAGSSEVRFVFRPLLYQAALIVFYGVAFASFFASTVLIAFNSGASKYGRHCAR